MTLEDPKIIAAAEATQAIVIFADYIQSLDSDLDSVDATVLAASAITLLPSLFEQNSNLKDLLIKGINWAKEEKARPME